MLALLKAWMFAGAVAALASLPGSVELFLLSVAALSPKRRRSTHAEGAFWRVAVVVPAHNEAVHIAACVRSLCDSAVENMQVDIVVIADNCSDDTAVIASACGARVLTRHHETERGKGYALNFAFTQLQPLGYDGVLVVDADTEVAPNFIAAAAGALRQGHAAVQTRYLVRNRQENIRTRLMALSTCGFNIVRLLGRERLGLSVGLLGNGFGLRSETLKAVPYLATSVVEDLEYHLALVAAGFRVHFVNDTSVSAEVPVRGKGAKTQRSRWEGGRFRVMYETAPRLMRELLKGRYSFAEPLMELLLLPIAFHFLLLLIAVTTPLTFARDIGAAGLIVLIVHLAAVVRIGGRGWRDVVILLAAPAYIFWKLLLLPSMLQNARAGQAWVRTKRNAEAETSL